MFLQHWMSYKKVAWWPAVICIVLITGIIAYGKSLDTDKEVLLDLRNFLLEKNPVKRGIYTRWNLHIDSPCYWRGISCTPDGARVSGISLSGNDITGKIFSNFSLLTELSHLDLSANSLSGVIPADLSRCRNLVYLNLSHNLLGGELKLVGLHNLEILDLSVNRLRGDIQPSLPAICDSLVAANISDNIFTGNLGYSLDKCHKLQYLDVSSNNFSGELWPGFARLVEFSASENDLGGYLLPSHFPANCGLHILDLSDNDLTGTVPGALSNCSSLQILNLSGNNLTGEIPKEIGLISGLKSLILGNNRLSREIPESLTNLSNLVFLDLSRNNFGGHIQDVFGRLLQMKYLVLHGNSYTDGIYSSGILNSTNISLLDLSYNNISGPLPSEISQLTSLKFLILAHNQFNGSIPTEVGNLPHLQVLDLSFNKLSGSIPPTIGKLSSLLFLMLAHNSLNGQIPPEIRNCTSLLWLNLADNQIYGKFPTELVNIGKKAWETFELNRQFDESDITGFDHCLTLSRWSPEDIPPRSFVHSTYTRKFCGSIWNNLLKGYGLFPVCPTGSTVRTVRISGYIQLNQNQLTGELPMEIAELQSISMLHLAFNNFHGKLPPEIGELPLKVLNVSRNGFSGEIPSELGNAKCFHSLDLSYNNFSGPLPESLNTLSELSKFSVSYNRYVFGTIPNTGQLATFDRESFLGNPLMYLPNFVNQTTNDSKRNTTSSGRSKESEDLSYFWVTFSASYPCFFTFTCIYFLFKQRKQNKQNRAARRTR